MMMLEDAEHVFLAILDIHISLIFRSQMKAKFEITSCFLSQNKTRSLLKFYFTSFCWNFSMASCSSILILPLHLLFTSFFTFCLTICFFFFLLKTKTIMVSLIIDRAQISLIDCLALSTASLVQLLLYTLLGWSKNIKKLIFMKTNWPFCGTRLSKSC